MLARLLRGLPLQRRLAGHGPVRLAVLLCGMTLIVVWQYGMEPYAARQGDAWRLEASSGLMEQTRYPRMARFVYFYHYLGLFPVATEREGLEYSEAGARRELAEHGDELVMEWGHAIRGGDLGKVLLYLPGAALTGTAESPSVGLANRVAFTAALVGLFAAFWWVRQPVLGGLAVAFLGSNPFQLYEVCGNENVFGWPITTCLAVLALHVPLLARRRVSRLYLWAVPIATGLLLATTRQIRSETAPVLASSLVCCLLVGGVRWRTRVGLVVALLAAFAGGSRGWRAYFGHKFEEARAAVASAGGHVYTGPRDHYHAFWHAVWCGLGDFDRKHGYAWNDMSAARYAHGVITERFGLELPPVEEGVVYHWGTWDAAGKYYRTHSEIPHYAEVLREKIVGDIRGDPLWYLGILARRVWRVLRETTPVRVSVGVGWLTVPMHGLMLLPVLGVLVWARSWMLAKLVCFPLPLSLTAVLIYSGDGTCFYSCYHLLVAAVVGAAAVELGLLPLGRSWRIRGREG